MRSTSGAPTPPSPTSFPGGNYVSAQVTQTKPCDPAQANCVLVVASVTDGDA